MECHARMTTSQTERTVKRRLARERLGLFNGSPTKDKQQTFPLWYSPPSVHCLTPHPCLVDRFLIELIYMVIGDFWAPLKEIQSNQSEFGVFFLLGQKRYLGNSYYGVKKKQKFLSKSTVTERLGCEFLFAGIGASRTVWASQLFVPILSHREEKGHRARTLWSVDSLSGLPFQFYFIIHS